MLMAERSNPYFPLISGSEQGNRSFTVAMLMLILFCCSLVDLPNRVSLGPVSVQGALTLSYGGLSLYMWLYRPTSTLRIYHGMSFIYFILWCWASFIWHEVNKSGLQNIFVFMTFFTLIVLVSREHARDGNFQNRIRKYLKVAVGIAMLIYFPSLVTDGLGNERWISSRGFALFALVGLAMLLSEWRYTQKKRWFFASLGVLLTITLSLSRTAMVAGVVLLIVSRYGFKGAKQKLKFFTFVATCLGLLGYTVFNFSPIQERFFEGDTSLSIGGIPVNAMGRTNIWDTVIQSYWNAPWVGGGAGSAESALARRFGVETQPHNDYLRILHDYGMVGFSIWFACLVGILIAAWRSWSKADTQGNISARNHMAAFLATVAIAIASLTDNVVIYMFVMAPAATLIGLSIGMQPEPDRESAVV